MKKEIQIAREVIEREIEGLKALEDALGDKFSEAVELILNCQGKLVLSGMGKSGHIATKIAATFASTGTPAIFVHPAEASHGDLGMISKNDIAILLSNSGETAELRDVIFYCKRFSIPIISIVRRKTSMLVEAADIPFVLPAVPEASPVAAPTTSTTMMLAWGDALAMAVMELKGFSKDDFGVFHPGGKLGSQFIKVSNVMAKEDRLPIIRPEDKMTDVILQITKYNLGCALTIDENKKLDGIITDGDLRRNMNEEIIFKTAKDLLHKNPKTIKANALAVEALAMMNKYSVTCLPVINDAEKLVGVVHIHHLLSNGIG
ncbi:MAG: KpsF/GutQ family sugar-phosphate isomerase [Rickettsiales bacterium]|nr:KpsF/GutQ family sugar-phosphate isomerase [Rickettsiales bacterium]